MDSAGYHIEHRGPLDQDVRASTSSVAIGNAAELRRMVFPPIRYVVPGYIVEGCTLLAGRPKLGKSWLVLEAGLAVARGGDCLGGIACDQGDVLYLALEDNRRRLQRRIDKLLGPFGEDWPAAFEYAVEWPRANDGGLDQIRDWIVSKANPRLVIVDVLAMFKPVRGSSESLYEADYAAIKGLQALAGQYGVAVVIVHHTRKSGTESDPFEKVSGTLGLSGAADTTLILDRDGNGATLYGRGRDIEEIETAVVFDKAGCRWFAQGEASEVRRTDERGAVLAALEDADEPMSPTDIADATRMPNQNVRQLLVSMVKAGEVTKLGRGRYGHPDHNHTPNHNDHKITKLADYRAAKGNHEHEPLDFDESVCDRQPPSCDRPDETGSQADEPAPSAPPLVCDDVTDVIGDVGIGGSEPAPIKNEPEQPCRSEPALQTDLPAAFDELVAPMLDHLDEVAKRSKARGTIVEAEPWRRSRRTNQHVATSFTISRISRGVKASAAPLVALTDKLTITPPYKRSVTVSSFGRTPGNIYDAGGPWPQWIVVVDGDHANAPFPTSPDAFDAWFTKWIAENEIRVIGDWRGEANAAGALAWLKPDEVPHA